MAAELAAKPPEKCRKAAGIVAIAAWIVPSVAAEKHTECAVPAGTNFP